jgi:hypothetical protein
VFARTGKHRQTMIIKMTMMILHRK